MPGKLWLPKDVRPLGELAKLSVAEGLRATSPLKFAPSDVAKDFVFFNHGVFFTHGGFKDDADPVGDWYAGLPTEVPVIKQAFREPIFDGLSALTIENRVPWDRVLCGVPVVYWDSLLEHLAGMCISDTKRGTVQLAYYAYLDVLDPSHVDQYGRLKLGLPTIQCCVFCLSGNTARYEFVRPYPLTRLPQLQKMPPADPVVDLAKHMEHGELDPLVHRHNPAHRDFLLAYQKAVKEGPKILECVQ